MYSNEYIWNLEKWYWRIYLQGSNGETHREWTCGHERGGEGETYGKSNRETFITMFKIHSQWEFAVWLRKLKQELCINLEGWDGGGSFKREGIYVYLWLIHVEVWQRTAEFCRAIILQLKKKKINLKKSHLPSYEQEIVGLIFFCVSSFVLKITPECWD